MEDLLKQIWNEEKQRESARQYPCLQQNYTDTNIILGCL